MSVSAPRVIFKLDEVTKKKLEPVEEVTIDVDNEYAGSVIDKMSLRGGNVLDYKEVQVCHRYVQ